MGNIKHPLEFEYYYSLGPTRSCRQVADYFNRKIGTVNTWCTKECWDNEVKLRDSQVLELAREKAVLDKLETITDYRKVIKASLAVYIDRLKKGKVDIKTVQDMERLMKLDITLLNEVEEVGLKSQATAVEDQTADASSNETVKGFTFDINGMPTAERKEKDRDGDINENKSE